MDYHTSDVQRVDFQRQAIERAEGNAKERQVFVGGVSMYASEDDLMHVFETCGTVVALRWGMDRRSKKFKGYVHVEFALASAVPLAVNKTGTDVCGRNIRVNAARGASHGKTAGSHKTDGYIAPGTAKFDAATSLSTNNHPEYDADSRSKPEPKKGVCLRCRQPGHQMADCPMMRGGGPTSQRKVAVSCYNCGGNSHRASHCRKAKIGNGFSFATCFICGTKGHLASQCDVNKQGMYPNGGGCRVCGSNQHLVKDCPDKINKKKKNKRKREEEMAAGGDSEAVGYYDTATGETSNVCPVVGSVGDSLGGNFESEKVDGGSTYSGLTGTEGVEEEDMPLKKKNKKKKKKKKKKSTHEKFED
jgi:hypothetical protein